MSSSLTPLTRFVFPAMTTVWMVGGGIVVFSDRSGDAVAKLGFLLFTGTINAFVWWDGLRLKEVSIDENFLYVSNYLKEISIPLSQICDVSENRLSRMHRVTIYLRTPTVFGEKIVFEPESKWFRFLKPHPVVEELIALARSNGAVIR